MFPTDPISNYINLSFAKKSDELSKVYAEQVVAARLKFQSPSGMRLQAIMQPAVENARARINAWVQIVRDACKEANRPVDNEVRAYIRAEVHHMCEGARKHTAHNLAMTLQRESMQHVPGVRESLSAQLNQRISQIETDIGRELKIEELKENVQKSAGEKVPQPVTPGALTPPGISISDKLTPASETGSASHKWTSFEKWATGFTVLLLLIAAVGLISNHDFRVWIGIEHPTRDPEPEAPKTDTPKTDTSKPRIEPPGSPPSVVPVPMPKPGGIEQRNEAAADGGRGVAVNIPGDGRNSTRTDGAATSPKVNNAPNGIINDGGTMTNPTVNNFGPRSRRITQQQHDEIVPMLTNDRARVVVWAYSTDPDTWGLAKDLYGVLKESGWSMEDPDVQAILPVNPNECDVVVFIPGEPGQPVTQLPGAPREVLTVLKTLGLTYKLGYSDKLGDAAVKIVVGPR
jgi:hypothetical protein